MLEPPDPTAQGTSLELPSEPDTRAPASSELELPPSAPPPGPSAETAAQTEPVPGPLGELVVAHFARVEIAMLARVLITTLAAALPASMIRVERRRSLSRRLAGRAGEPVGITITAGERMLSLRAPEVGTAQASIGHSVRGVVLSNTPVPISRWLAELGQLLDGLTRDDEDARAALERALLS